MKIPTELEDYLFDLRGYLVLEDALSPEEVVELNTALDDLLAKREPVDPKVRAREGYNNFGLWHSNVVEAGEVFERLIDHPSWISHIHRYVGNQDKPVLEESVAIVRVEGQASHLHSGAHKRRQYPQFRYHDGQFRCGEVNIMMALNDWHSGDGVTMVVPGSHKSNIIHPALVTAAKEPGGSLDTVTGAVEVLMDAGDVVLFVDCLAHGSGRRTNPGERRSLLYRYGPKWRTYRPSDELMERLTPDRQALMNV